MEQIFSLHLFDASGGGEGGATGEAGTAANPVAAEQGRDLSNVKYGKQAEESASAESPAEQPPVDRAKEFERLIKGDYKDEFTKRTQKIIDSRFKETKNLENRIASMQPMLDMLSSKYGVQVNGDDYSSLIKAIEDDDSYYEEEAVEKGMTVEQLKHLKRIERENAELTRAIEKNNQREKAQEIYNKWIQEGEELKQIYPTFDFDVELQNEQFASLIQRGIDVRTAFEVLHKDDILGGAMQFTANQVAQKMANSLASRASRPQENGVSTKPASVTKTDVNSLTKADREEIERRVLRGERITF